MNFGGMILSDRTADTTAKTTSSSLPCALHFGVNLSARPLRCWNRVLHTLEEFAEIEIASGTIFWGPPNLLALLPVHDTQSIF
jgi:hypothetical protein